MVLLPLCSSASIYKYEYAYDLFIKILLNYKIRFDYTLIFLQFDYVYEIISEVFKPNKNIEKGKKIAKIKKKTNKRSECKRGNFDLYEPESPLKKVLIKWYFFFLGLTNKQEGHIHRVCTVELNVKKQSCVWIHL